MAEEWGNVIFAARRYNEDTTRDSVFTYTNSNNTKGEKKAETCIGALRCTENVQSNYSLITWYAQYTSPLACLGVGRGGTGQHRNVKSLLFSNEEKVVVFY